MESLVSAINGVWYWHREPYHTSRINSPWGHTIHYMERGSYELTLNGKVMTVQAGDMVFYGSAENHTWRGNDSSPSFYSINFLPGNLDLPPDHRRRVATDRTPAPWFTVAYEAFKESRDPVAQARCFSALYQILAYVRSLGTSGGGEEIGLWRSLEKMVLQKRLFRIPIGELARRSGYNESTVYRACMALHGQSPQVRLREIRMEEARNLILHSTLPIGAIASELGFPRIHEFSREFSRTQGIAPLAFRKKHGEAHNDF